ncbi:MAG: transposase family protein, partial [Lentisphaerae bacterium]|nr:transposase family protein [Lentisphaerota bacterium]
MPVNLYYTQRVRGFQQESVKYSKESVEIRLKRTKHQCPHCGSTSVTVEPLRSRRIRGEPLGNCRQVVLELTIHRLYCPRCHFRVLEHIPFLSHPKARLTKTLERTILELRPHMSIQALANFYGLRWHTIKELEKKHLKKKYSRIPTAHIKAIGIDEIHVGK